MSKSNIRFSVCVWAALTATVLELAGIGVAAANATRAPVNATRGLVAQASAQHQFVGAGERASLR